MQRSPSLLRPVLAAAVVAAAAGLAQGAWASEGGASVYLLGSGGPGVAVMPPVQGVFFNNEIYYYKAKAGGGKQFPLGGGVVADLDATIAADFATVLFVPSTDFAGGVLGLGLALPFGEPEVKVSAVITGPRGGQTGVKVSDSAFVLGDPIATAMVGWKSGKWHTQASTIVNIPIGDYREDELANLAFHRWAGDVSFAFTRLDEESGWDLSGKAGFTFNGENEHTEYTTGTEFHVEAAIEKKVSKTWSLGVQGYYYQQVSGDSGPGATLGPFKGRVAGVGLTTAHTFEMGKKPATLRLSAATEFDAKNRPEGNSVWLTFSVPLHMKLPAGAGG